LIVGPPITFYLLVIGGGPLIVEIGGPLGLIPIPGPPPICGFLIGPPPPRLELLTLVFREVDSSDCIGY